MLDQKVNEIQERALASFSSAASSGDLYELKVKFLGKTGEFSKVMKEMGKLSKEERPAFGKMVNEVKRSLEAKYGEIENELKNAEMSQKLASEFLDMTLPGVSPPKGSRHLIGQTIREIVEILSQLGYSVRTGPLIESDRNNFEALNIPPFHPARDMQDTFYIDQSHVLRTHTSPIQIRTMEREKPPLRIIAPGSVFRCDADASHSPNFHQIECLLVDEKVSMGDLKGTISFFIKKLFGDDIKTRFRPSFFPFTEPSAEVDCMCPICRGKGCRMCSQSGWVEIGGCGLVNPKVFAHVGIEYPKWQGFAFGFGIERMAIIKYGVDHIRLFTDNDMRFLEQFR